MKHLTLTKMTKKLRVEEKKDINKERLLQALEESLGIVTIACKMVGISRGTYYLYLNNDEDFKSKVADISEIALDFAEHSLLTQIKAGETTATIFYLKTKGKNRGYNAEEKRTLEFGEDVVKLITGMQIK